MSLTKANILYGPFDLDMTGGTGFSRTGLVPDSVVWGTETKKGNKVLEDGREQNWEAGQILTMEITFDEVLPADITLIRACTALTIAFSAPSKTVTVAAEVTDTSTLAIFCDVVDGKTKITIIKTAKVGSAINDLIAIA